MSTLPDVVVRPERAEDRVASLRVVHDAFAVASPEDGVHVAALVAGMRDEADACGHRALVAVDGEGADGGEVVGHVGLTRGWVDARDRLVEIAVLSPLAVRPDRHGRGTGAALVAAAVTTCDREGLPLVLLEGDPGFYGRLGWVAADTLGLERPSDRIPPPACQVVPLTAYDDGVTGRLVYPDLFWRHDAVGLRGERLATVEAALERAREAGDGQ